MPAILMIYLALGFALMVVSPSFCAEAEKQPLRAQPWAFGQSPQRNDAIWRKGVDAETVTKRSCPVPPSREKATDTTRAIDEALSDAEQKKAKGGVGMSMVNEAGTWKVAPEQKKQHPDENMFRDRRHVVRAFADVKTGDGLNISVGPELILKDEAHAEESASEDQPDSALGVGMRFKYDF